MSEDFKMMTAQEMNEIIERFGSSIPKFSEKAHKVNICMREAAYAVDRMEKELKENGFMDMEMLDYIRLQHALILKIIDRVIDIDIGKPEQKGPEEYTILDEESDTSTVIVINIRGGGQ